MEIVPGAVLELSEEQYKFGTGQLTLRVDSLIGRLRLADGHWMHLRGTALWDGKPAEQRTVYVRLS